MQKTVTILLIALSSVGWSQQNDWSKRARFGGEKRARAIGFSIGDYGYAGMGEDTVEMTHNDLWRFDPLSNSWAQVASLPGSTRRNATAVTIGDFGYVGLGADSSLSSAGTILNDWWQYDPVGNSWLPKTSYPGGFNYLNGSPNWPGVYFATAYEINGKGYICCGKTGPDEYGSDLWEYDPNLDTWTRMADFPGLDRYQLSSFSVDGKGYVGMGIDHDLYRKDWWQYDPLLDSWIQVSNLPGVERGSASSFTLGQRGYVVFGSDGGYKDELWEYNPFTDSWMIRANFPGGERKNAFTFAIGDSAYAGTGKGASGKRRNFYVYYPLFPIGIEENGVETKIYPNPANEILYVNTGMPNVTVQIVNLHGQEILRSNEAQIDVSQIAPGTYILNLFDSNNLHLETQKVIIQK